MLLPRLLLTLASALVISVSGIAATAPNDTESAAIAEVEKFHADWREVAASDGFKAWFADPAWALPAAILVETWHGFPFFALLLLAGLKGIPTELYEAAEVDGARLWHRFRYIQLPGLRMIIVASVVLRAISLMNSPELLLILTGGGPGRSTQVLSLYAFQKAYREFNFGYAGALSVVMLLLLMVGSYVYVRRSNVLKDE